MTQNLTRSSIFIKARAISELIRMDLVFGAGIFVIAGKILALGDLPPLHQILLGFLTGFFVSGSANIANDYFDLKVDRINRPGRPLPSNCVSVAGIRPWLFSFPPPALQPQRSSGRRCWRRPGLCGSSRIATT